MTRSKPKLTAGEKRAQEQKLMAAFGQIADPALRKAFLLQVKDAEELEARRRDEAKAGKKSQRSMNDKAGGKARQPEN